MLTGALLVGCTLTAVAACSLARSEWRLYRREHASRDRWVRRHR